MSFQVIVREVKPVNPPQIFQGQTIATNSEQIYEQTVDQLDLNRVIAAVNHKPRVRKPRQVTASPTPRT